MLEDRTISTAGGPQDPSKSAAAGASVASPAKGSADTYSMLRQLGGRAYQVRAAARAADVFIAREATEDRDTGSWLISSAVDLAEDLATDLDGLARNLRERPPESGLMHPLQKLRVRAHQLHAAARAADHFLDQEGSDDRSTGSWLIAFALSLSDKLATEIDDLASSVKKPVTETANVFSDVTAPRRAGIAPTLRGATV